MTEATDVNYSTYGLVALDSETGPSLLASPCNGLVYEKYSINYFLCCHAICSSDTVSGLGKVAVVQNLGQPTVPGQAFCVVRLRPNAPITPTALVQYLRSAVGQTLLDKAGQGETVSFVPMGEVKRLPVVIPHASELQRAVSLEEENLALSREVEELSRKLQRLSRQGWMEDLPPSLLAGEQGEAA